MNDVQPNQQRRTLETAIKGSIKGSIKNAALTSLRQLYGWRSSVQIKPFRYIFIVGHQRTGSSMLTQIICSHPSISGFGESRTAYRSRSDLRKLRGEVFRIHGKFWNLEPYVLDKVLFNELLPDVDLIDGPDVRWIFLLRDPIRTMRSMIQMFGDESIQLQYYRDRVAWLRRAADQLSSSDRSFFTTYDRLIEDADHELYALSDFLELDSPLAQEYKLQPRAGMEGVGDPSERIKSGRIIARQREHPFSPCDDTADVLMKEYERTLFTLSRCCDCTPATREFADSFSSFSNASEYQQQ